MEMILLKLLSTKCSKSLTRQSLSILYNALVINATSNKYPSQNLPLSSSKMESKEPMSKKIKYKRL